MMRNLDTALLRTFVTVADSGSMTVAANRLNMTQGAISQQVKRLEDSLGGNLFERDRRGLRLTPRGERLFGKARRLLSLNDEICAELTEGAISGRVRLGVPYDLVEPCMAPILKAYAEAHPQVEITLTTQTSPALTAALASGEIDLAIAEAPVGVPAMLDTTAGDGEGLATECLASECLAVERLVWVGARGGTAYRKRPLPLSLVSDTCAFRPLVLSALQADDIDWRTVFENGIEATRTIVRADLAVTAWLANTVPGDLDILGAEARLPELPSFTINLHLPRHGASPAAREFARYLREGLSRQRAAA